MSETADDDHAFGRGQRVNPFGDVATLGIRTESKVEKSKKWRKVGRLVNPEDHPVFQ